MAKRGRTPLSSLEYHVLLALAEGPRHGYAVLRAVEEDSGGEVRARPASFYRVIARLVSWGLVSEADPPPDAGPHPGLERKYYALTPAGSEAMGNEAGRLRRAAELAERRLGLVTGGGRAK